MEVSSEFLDTFHEELSILFFEQSFDIILVLIVVEVS